MAGDLPSNNFGSAAELESDLSPIRESYLKFDLRPLTNLTISGATLRMYVTSGSSHTQSIKQVADNTWTEGAITYTNRPSTGGTVTTFLQPSANVWNEINITTAVAAATGSFMSLAIDNSGNDGYRFSSDEAATNRVELVVSWSGGGGGGANPDANAAPHAHTCADGDTNAESYVYAAARRALLLRRRW